jgi:hypothetical protein
MTALHGAQRRSYHALASDCANAPTLSPCCKSAKVIQQLLTHFSPEEIRKALFHIKTQSAICRLHRGHFHGA